MISVIIIWCVIALTSYITGLLPVPMPAGDGATASPFPAHLRRIRTAVRGLILIGIYAEAFSLFHGVSATALLFLLVIDACIAFYYRKFITTDLRDMFASMRKHPQITIPSVCTVLLLAFFTAQGTFHIDTPLYHAMSIHWIEEYGVVRGLGNLQTHFAYNNACFPLYALYSFAFVNGQSFHAVQGFLALLVVQICLPVIRTLTERTKHLPVSFFARCAALCYICTILDELVSPSADVFFSLLVCYIVITWLDLDEKKEASPYPYAMLVLAIVYCVTVKLAAAPLLLLAIRPVAGFLKAGVKRFIATFTLLGILTALPYFIRNYILSGWLLFPLASIDLFDPVWKIPEGTVRFEAYDIEMTGRAIFTFSGEAIPPVTAWFPGWFLRQSVFNRALFLLAVCAVVIFLLQCILNRLPRTNTVSSGGTLKLPAAGRNTPTFLTTVLILSLVFWFFTTPQIRFGEAYLWLVSAIVFGGFLKNFTVTAPLGITACAVLLLIGIVRAAPYHTDYLIIQQDYDRYECETYQIGDFTFYTPIGTTTAGYYDFPSTRWKVENIYPLGDDLSDGFATVESELPDA